MDAPNTTIARQIADAARSFQQRQTGHAPQSVTVVLGRDTLVITLHGALSPAERDLARTPAGAAQVQEFHRQLFASSAVAFRQEIMRITSLRVQEATAEVEPASGAVVHAFTNGTLVQVFLFAASVPLDGGPPRPDSPAAAHLPPVPDPPAGSANPPQTGDAPAPGIQP
jgi:uncharacterized protein YbcI